MTYTEIKERNGRKYYYRTASFREGSKIRKKRLYLGVNLTMAELSSKKKEVDEIRASCREDKSLDKIKSKIRFILKKNKVKKAGIFGSFSRGKAKKDSDVDIVIELPAKVGFRFIGIKYELEKKLGRKVDLITYKSIHPLIRNKILAEEKRII